MAGPVHFEVYARKTVAASWKLEQALESRERAVQLAETLLDDKRAVAVRVTRETLDPQSMEFVSTTVLQRGAPEPKRPSRVRVEATFQPCNAPPDLYAPRARQLIGRVLDDWLARRRVTAFELLHRPDLVELLEASGVEMQHAIQKVAVPESQASGQPVHEIIRHYQRLTEQASERLIKIGRGGGFPNLDGQPLSDVARKARAGERAFMVGGAVAGAISGAGGWSAKLNALLNLADTIPDSDDADPAIRAVLEALVIEILSTRDGLLAVLGADLDLGGQLAVLMQLAGPKEARALMTADPRLAAVMPGLSEPARRLQTRMNASAWTVTAKAFARQVLAELNGPRRLRPSDAAGEIEILRGLAMLLTAQAGRLLTLEEAQTAFSERSKTLVAADFVASYVGQDVTPVEEVQALVRLCENVTGGAAKRSAARWLSAAVSALKFERALREASTGALQKLRLLSDLQGRVRACDLAERDSLAIEQGLGHVGGLVEADGRVASLLARTDRPPVQVLTLLLRMAMGEGCPTGPAAERARAEALKMLRSPQTRRAVAEDPRNLMALKPLLRSAGLAA